MHGAGAPSSYVIAVHIPVACAIHVQAIKLERRKMLLFSDEGAWNSHAERQLH